MYLLPSATKLRRLCFYKHVSVHGGGVPDQVHPPGPGTPSRTRYTPGTRYTLPGTRYTPLGPGAPPGPGTPPPGPGTPLPDQVHPPDLVHPQGPCTPPDQVHPAGPGTPPRDTATAKDGTHPTGMHSCHILLIVV